MNGNRFLLDTNAIVALLDGNTAINRLIIRADWVGVSIISVLEYMSFSNLSIDDLDLLNTFLKRIDVAGLEMNNFTLLLNTSQIRITYKLKLPDAIIAATSAAHNASLITADRGFDKVKEIRVVGF
jgi:predicted nucleic acid-binding protein